MADEPPFNSGLAAPTPSEAIRRGWCPMCLGTGTTFHIIEDRLGPCSGCGGAATLDAMMARQCGDPDCPEHGHG